MFNYFWKMRYVWAVAHISLIYSLFQAPQYFFYGLLWGAFATMIGSYAGWHRYWAHRSYKTDTIRKNIMTWMGILGCTGKPITVIGGHRIHHKHSDTENDIHSPRDRSWWEILFGFYEEKDMPSGSRKMMKDLVQDPHLKFIQAHYFKIISVFILVLLLIDPILVGYIFGFPALYSLYISVFVINYLLHLHGHQDHETGDDSKNHWLLSLVTLGEGWHNNHHNNSLNYTTKEKWYQIDPTGTFIKYFIATDLEHEHLY